MMEQSKKQPQHGKKPNQKLKTFVVLQYLQRNTDENHVCNASDIVDYLNECGIAAERRSIYSDIAEINKAMYMIEQGTDINSAAEELEQYEDEKLIVYDAKRKGFYFRRRQFDLNDIRLLVECIYSAKFISEKHVGLLVDVACSMVSDPQAERIKRSATYLLDRVKTTNNAVILNMDIIRDAMSTSIDGLRHTPEKISFDYMHYSITDLKQHVKSRSAGKYVVSPYRLLIDNGNFYLLAYDEKEKKPDKKIKTYRVDRMVNVSLTGKPRSGADEYKSRSVKDHARSCFGMMSGKIRRVEIQFVDTLMDIAVERFGKGGDTFYHKVDDHHFSVSTDVQISDQFFAWLCGFGKRVKLLNPPDVIEDFKEYLNKIQEMY